MRCGGGVQEAMADRITLCTMASILSTWSTVISVLCSREEPEFREIRNENSISGPKHATFREIPPTLRLRPWGC